VIRTFVRIDRKSVRFIFVRNNDVSFTIVMVDAIDNSRIVVKKKENKSYVCKTMLDSLGTHAEAMFVEYRSCMRVISIPSYRLYGYSQWRPCMCSVYTKLWRTFLVLEPTSKCPESVFQHEPHIPNWTLVLPRASNTLSNTALPHQQKTPAYPQSLPLRLPTTSNQ